MAVIALLGAAPPVQGQGVATLAPPHDDAGVDVDGDAFYDFLLVNVHVDVTAAGQFILVVDLYDNSGMSLITNQWALPVLPVGSAIVPVNLSGLAIRTSMFNGPYVADIHLYDDTFFLLDSGVHMTQAYQWTEFERPGLSFAPPHADTAFDTDGDLLYDVLRVSWSVDVLDAGDYVFTADLYDSLFSWIDNVYVPATLAAGPQTVDTDFVGWRVYANGVDGPFTAQVTAIDPMGGPIAMDTHTTAPYPWNGFDAPPFEFTPPHADGVEDTDGDGLYNVLYVNWTADVGIAGTYRLSVGLYDPSSFWIDSIDETKVLAAGPQSVTTTFPGWVVRLSGLDGPYEARASVYNATGVSLDNDRHTTAAYLWGDFETPPVSLNPPHADAGVDTDGDARYDHIAIDVNVTVDDPGSYEVDVDLYDGSGTNLLGMNQTTEVLAAGPQTLTLGFPTLPMQAQGIDGPYQAFIDLYVSGGRFIERGTHVTRAYTVAEFDPLPAAFAPPHWDRGVDRDAPPDGEYNVLEATINVTVLEAGTFAVIGQLTDLAGMTPLGQDVFLGPLPAGDRSVVLAFSGVDLRNAGIDGPYRLELLLFAAGGGPFPIRIDQDVHVTRAYAWTDFQSVTPADLTGAVRDRTSGAGIPGAGIQAFDYLNEVTRFGSAGPTGTYTLPLYRGDWVVTFAGPDSNAELARASLVAPSTVLDADLWPYVPLSTTMDVAMPTWRDADWSSVDLEEPNNRTFRLQFDWLYGNRDQVLTQQEFDAYIALLGFLPGTPPADTADEFLVDGLAYDLVAGSDDFQFRDIPGPIDSTTPPSLATSASYANPAIPSAPAHTVDVSVEYDQDWQSFGSRVTLPTGFVVRSYTGPPEVRVSGVGTRVVVLDAGPDPIPFDSVTSVWVRLLVADGVAPTAEAGPDQTVTEGASVTFDGTGSTDNDQIVGYWWNFTDGGAQSLTGATPSYTFDTPGTYVVTLTVVDRAGLAGTDTVTVFVNAAVGAVEGTVTGTGSAAVAGATVRLMNGTAEVNATTTDASGHYAFAGVLPGAYKVRVTATGYQAAERDVTVVAGQTATADVQLTATPEGIAGLPYWAWGLLVVVIVAVAAVAFLLWRRRKMAATAPAPPPAASPPPSQPASPPRAPQTPPPPSS